MRTTTSFEAVCLFILLAGGMRGQELPRATTQYGAFAFPDPSGTRLLTVSDLLQPAVLHNALCSGGRRFPVLFERRQAAREGQNGRQTPYDFAKLAGSVFTISQGKIEIGASCFLASNRLLSSATLLPAEPRTGPRECDPDVLGRLASARSRKVVNCWTLARLPAGRRLVLLEFARQDKDALASVVLTDRDRIIFADYPALFPGEGEDLWRVDDGGVLSAEGFKVVFLLQRGTFYALGINWSGAEGASLTVYVSNGDSRFTNAIEDYWHRAPV